MPDSDQTLLQVGSTAADFELPDTDNHPRRLSELAGGDAVAVVFYRGHW
jgi:peroxiredoxin